MSLGKLNLFVQHAINKVNSTDPYYLYYYANRESFGTTGPCSSKITVCLIMTCRTIQTKMQTPWSLSARTPSARARISTSALIQSIAITNKTRIRSSYSKALWSKYYRRTHRGYLWLRSPNTLKRNSNFKLTCRNLGSPNSRTSWIPYKAGCS